MITIPPRLSHQTDLSALDQQRVMALLASAKSVDAVGPRPSSKRKLYAALVLAAGVLTGAMISHPETISQAVEKMWDRVSVSIENILPGSSRVISTPIAPPSSPVVVTPKELSPWWVAAQTQADTPPSADDFIALAQSQNLSPTEAYTVLLHMIRADRTVILGRDQDVLRIQEEQRQDISRRWLQSAWEDEGSLKKLVEADPLLQKDINDHPYSWSYFLSEDEQWERVRAEWGRQMSAALQPSRPGHFLTKSNESLLLDQALTNLAQTVQDVGLAALYLPPQMMHDPVLIQEMDQRLRRANQELETLTGWKGALLGINHRVVMDLANSDQNGYVTTDQSGFIRMHAWWGNLAHEWFHALDFAQTQEVGKTMSSPLSHHINLNGALPPTWKQIAPVVAQHQLWRAIQNPSLTDQDRANIAQEARARRNAFGDISQTTSMMFQALYEVDQKAASNVPVSGSPWVHWRKSASELTDEKNLAMMSDPGADYLVSPTEMMAFSFHAHAAAQMKNNPDGSVLRDQLLWTAVSSPSYEPTMTEALASRQNWSNYFEKTKVWWSNDQHERLMQDPSRVEVFLQDPKPAPYRSGPPK